MAVMAIYKGSPTQGGTDGVKVVSGNPIVTPYLDLKTNQTTEVKLALRCDAGYQAIGLVTIEPKSGETTLSADAAIGAQTISVASAAGFQVNNLVEIGEAKEVRRVVAIVENVLTLGAALTGAHVTGAAVVCRSKYKIKLAHDVDGVPGEYSTLLFKTDVAATNVVFWAQIRAEADELEPYKDTSARIEVSYTAGAV